MNYPFKFYHKFFSNLDNRNPVWYVDFIWTDNDQASNPTNEEGYSNNLKLSYIRHSSVYIKPKLLRKQQNSSFAKLTDSISNIKHDTMLDYTQVGSDFITLFLKVRQKVLLIIWN